MKKLLTVLVSAILCVCACFCVTGCDCSNKKDSAQYVDPRSKQITIGITNSAPMNYKNSDGKWIGFDTELAVMTFNALGYNVMFKEIVWNNKYSELKSGTINCIWNAFTANSSDKIDGVSKPRNEIVSLSANYMINEQCIIKNKTVTFNKIEGDDDDKTLALTAAQFQGKTIAFESGSSGDAGVGYLKEDYPDVSFISKSFAAQSNAIVDVNNGNSDFAVVDLSLAENALNGYSNIEIVSSDVFDYFGIEYYAVAFPYDNDGAALASKVNGMINLFYKLGYIQELCKKYKIDFESRIKPLFES